MKTRYFFAQDLIQSKMSALLNIDNTPPPSILQNLDLTLAGLERIRAFLRSPMTVTSGYRCGRLNEAVGGSADSQHMQGLAADWKCPSLGEPAKICLMLAPMVAILGIDQLILEPGWIHTSFTLDPRNEMLRYVKGKYIPGLVGETDKI